MIGIIINLYFVIYSVCLNNLWIGNEKIKLFFDLCFFLGCCMEFNVGGGVI